MLLKFPRWLPNVARRFYGINVLNIVVYKIWKPVTHALHRLYRGLKASLPEAPPPEKCVGIAWRMKRRLRRWLVKEYTGYTRSVNTQIVLLH